MRNSNRMTLNHRMSVYTLAVLTPLIGSFFLGEDIQGKVLKPVTLEIDSSAVVAEVPPSDLATSPVVLPDSVIELTLRNPKAVKPLPPAYIDTETLWLARVMYSETKRIEEQELVGWVVRNRVETAYRGEKTYKGVALDPYQFSAFNPRSRKQRYYSNLSVDSKARGWQKTLALAYHVRHADGEHRPFPLKTRHFYSERSMPRDVVHPAWSQGMKPVTPARKIKLEARRFRFFSGVY